MFKTYMGQTDRPDQTNKISIIVVLSNFFNFNFLDLKNTLNNLRQELFKQKRKLQQLTEFKI